MKNNKYFVAKRERVGRHKRWRDNYSIIILLFVTGITLNSIFSSRNAQWNAHHDDRKTLTEVGGSECRITSGIKETIQKRQVPKTHKWNESTPWDDVIRVHLVANDINFHNKQIKVNSLDHHPTESGHQEILRESCCRNTESLWDKRESRIFVCFNTPFLRIT